MEEKKQLSDNRAYDKNGFKKFRKWSKKKTKTTGGINKMDPFRMPVDLKTEILATIFGLLCASLLTLLITIVTKIFFPGLFKEVIG